MNIAEELEKLEKMRQSGALSEAEFLKAKESLLAGQSATAGQQAPPAVQAKEVRQWCMFLHLSQLAGFVIPFAGLVLPIVLWQIKKAEMPEIDAHGKVVVNWIISAVIYFVAGLILSVVLIGIPVMIAVGLLAIVFPIIGGIKANDGVLWKYPLTITILR